MSLRLACPSCGAEHLLHNPGITVVVCSSCDTTLYREQEVLRAGKTSIPGEPRSNLAVGSTGKVADREVTLIGRIRFRGADSTWDEWFGHDEQGREVWVIEDEKNYALQRALGTPVAGARPDLDIGAELTLAGRRYQVDERGEAECLGGEGQLPRGIQPGERYRFIDTTEINGSTELSVEFSGAHPEGVAFVGRSVPPQQVIFAPAEGAEYTAPVQQAAAIRCPNCGGSFSPPRQGEAARTATCPYCDSILKLSGAAATITGSNPGKRSFPFAIGDKGTLRGREWEVVGRLVYRCGGWLTTEYLLWAEGAGYLWLEESDGHFNAMKPTAIGPALSDVRPLFPKDRIDIGGTTFQLFEQGRSVLEYVDGALPWSAAVGDTSQYIDFIAPPRVYSMELSEGRELERFVGDYIPPRAVFAAFGKEDRYLPPREAGAAQPNPVGATGKFIGLLGIIFCLINLNLTMMTLVDAPTLVELSTREFTELESEPFTIAEGADVIGLHISTGTDNSWVFVTTELVDAESEASVGAVGSEVSYYHGTEGGERWSEGSRTSSRYLKAPPPGEYQILAELEGDRTVPVTVRITAGDRLTRYPLILALLMALFPVGVFMRWRAFERDRWDEEG